MDGDTTSEDNFKSVFKYYKRRVPPPTFESAVDTRYPTDALEPQTLVNYDNQFDLDKLYVKPLNDWNIYRFKSKNVPPGLIVISNVFQGNGHAQWALRCLRDYARNPPHKTNMDNQVAEKDFVWWHQVTKTKDDKLMQKLRWATVGYHHNWDTKIYSPSDTSTFPSDLSDASRLIAGAIGYPDFHPEAAIVNFYPMDATLGGHTDHSEPNRAPPLISISLGQSAVFLIGGRSRSEVPEAILVHSGDVLVMTSEAREAVHAVPRIMPGSSSPWARQTSDEELSFCQEYLNNHRININIRQVY